MKIRFIVNPKSGKKQSDAPQRAEYLRTHFPQADVYLTNAPGHATELAREAAGHNYHAVIVVGGDGTLNEAANGLTYTQTALGIIPQGSGNGFARTLGMPLLFKEAAHALPHTRIAPCDIGRVNGELFLNIAGVGLEAEIARQFMEYGKSGKRGKWPYFKLGLQAVLSYQPRTLAMVVDGKKEFRCPLTLAFANGQQYGSGCKIAPQANLSDGLLDMVSVQAAPKWQLALAFPGFFKDDWKHYRHLTETSRVKQVHLECAGSFPYHIDGEVRQANGELDVAIEHKALRILIPKKQHAK
ncbi:MAG: diacylglycerol kinase family lipid kinase [Elusimicrobiaceae bacterium]|nr:diacylglycerol kinase family lipid kinase [Elusimicrobiaceae bacterium]